MCWMCDHPDATDEDYFDLVREVIDRQGWFIQGVERERWRPGFAYTVGLTGLRLPELLVTGMADRDAADLLNGVAHRMVCHDEHLDAGAQHAWPGPIRAEIVEVAEPTVHLVMAHRLYGPAIRAVQLVRADDRGRWPWEVGFRGNQPVLGPRAVARRNQ